MTEFLNSSAVKAEIERRGATFTKVSFVKKNGDVRTYVGRPKTHSRRIDRATATPQQIAASDRATKALADNGNVWLDFPQIKVGDDGRPRKGFSFNLGRVVAIGGLGTHPEPEQDA